MGTLLRDVRYATRNLLKHAGLTAIIVTTLAFGIGVNTAIFSVVYAALLRPLPLPEADRVAFAFTKIRGANDNPVSYADLDDWRKQNHSFESLAAYFNRNLVLTGKEEPTPLRVTAVTEGYFRVLGVDPLRGRVFSTTEHQAGANLVAVVSHDFWMQRFGGSQSILDQTVRLDDQNYTVIGVMPALMPNFSAHSRTEVWVPLEPNVPWRQRGWNYLTVLGRLKPGVTIGHAQSEMDVIAERLQVDYPANTGVGIRLVPLHQYLFGDLRVSLLILWGAVVFVLLIGASNIANLLLARATSRRKEFGIRLALGASRLRLVRQMLTESLLLALIGGTLGTLLTVWLIDLIVGFWPAHVLRPDRITLDWHVLGFTVAVTIATGIFFGIIPAWQATKTTLSQTLKEASGRTDDAGSNRLRGLLVVSETALATLLLLGAGLMIKSFWLARHVDPGFNSENLLSVPIALPESKYKDDQQIASFFKQTLDGIAVLPGVQAVGAINNLPLAGGGMSGTFRVEGQTFPTGQDPQSQKYIVSRDYFRAMGIPLLKGRLFGAQDMTGKPGVVIVNQTMARHFWPNEDPLGKRIAWGDAWQEVVGVVGDVKHEGLETTSEFQSYASSLQDPSSGMTVVVRTTADPMNAVTAIKSVIHAIDQDQPIINVKTMDQIVSESVSQRRLSAYLLGAFATLALLLSAIGIYGVMAYWVTQRTHEIGIRMALGAQMRHVLKLVLRNGIALTLLGVAIGLGGALALTRLMRTLLFDVTPTDGATFAAVSALLIIVASLACYIPARRATRVDPLVALRYE